MGDKRRISTFRLRGTPVFDMMATMKHMGMLVALAGALLFSGCRISDIRVLTVNVPGLSSEADIAHIRQALAPLNGVDKDKMAFDLKAHTVVVTFDSMVVANKNIEIAIAEAGYDANEITAASAKLPKK